MSKRIMYIADLHIHSKYSRATSRDCDAPHLELWARYKGLGLIGTGDLTHPAWRQALQEALEPAEEGLYTLKEEARLPESRAFCGQPPRFVVSGEISCIYKRHGRTRKVHNLILLPSLEAADACPAGWKPLATSVPMGGPSWGWIAGTCWRSPFPVAHRPCLSPPISGRPTFPCLGLFPALIP